MAGGRVPVLTTHATGEGSEKQSLAKVCFLDIPEGQRVPSLEDLYYHEGPTALLAAWYQTELVRRFDLSGRLLWPSSRHEYARHRHSDLAVAQIRFRGVGHRLLDRIECLRRLRLQDLCNAHRAAH